MVIFCDLIRYNPWIRNFSKKCLFCDREFKKLGQLIKHFNNTGMQEVYDFCYRFFELFWDLEMILYTQTAG